MYFCTVAYDAGDEDDLITAGKTLTEAGSRMAKILGQDLGWIAMECVFYRAGEKVCPHLEERLVE